MSATARGELRAPARIAPAAEETSDRASGPESGPAGSRTAGGGVASLLVLTAVAVIYLYQFGMNMAASSGMPYWDDWGYFFGDHIGVQLPLSFATVFAKDADHIAPVLKLLTHGLWQLAGVDLLAFRVAGWIAFGLMLAGYARLVLGTAGPAADPQRRDGAGAGWAGAAALLPFLLLVSTANREYFYFQSVGFSQPIFYVFLFGFLYALARDRLAAACLLLVPVGSTGIFGAGYVLGLAGAMVLAALLRQPRAPLGFLRDHRLVLPLLLGLGLVAAVGVLTFHGSYLNHTEQALVRPWQREFWYFVLGCLRAALGLGEGTGPSAFPLPVPPTLQDARLQGAAALALYLLPLPFLLGRRNHHDGNRHDGSRQAALGDIALAGFIAGTILVTIVTAAGRAHLCGPGPAEAMACGATPRYVYPVLLALPAVVAAWLRLLPSPAWRIPAAVAILVPLAAAAGLDHELKPSADRWRVAPLNAAVMDRDRAARACLQDYLLAVQPVARAATGAAAGTATGAAPWETPLTCPSVSPRNMNRFLQVAYEQKAAFLAPLLAADPGERQTRLAAALRTGAFAGEGPGAEGTETGSRGLRPTTAEAGGIAGWVDTAARLKDGTPALSGWAADTGRREAPAFVLLVADGPGTGGPGTGGLGTGGRIVAAGGTGGARPDVGRHFGDGRLAATGFLVPVPAGLLADPQTRLRVFAVSRSFAAVELMPAGGVAAGAFRGLAPDSTAPAAGR